LHAEGIPTGVASLGHMLLQQAVKNGLPDDASLEMGRRTGEAELARRHGEKAQEVIRQARAVFSRLDKRDPRIGDMLVTGKKIYFERCAGCHGVLRKGATGKNLEPHWSKKAKDGSVQEGGTLKLGTGRLEKIIALGTEGGMVNYDDILTKEEINVMARYIQRTPDVPPEFSLKDMEASWKLLVPVDQRPKKQQSKVNLKNVFAITLRDAGEAGPDRRRHQADLADPEDRLRGAHLAHVGLGPLCLHGGPRRPGDADRPLVREAHHGGHGEDRLPMHARWTPRSSRATRTST
jgi:mono/diheme cytochrome c family protein